MLTLQSKTSTNGACQTHLYQTNFSWLRKMKVKFSLVAVQTFKSNTSNASHFEVEIPNTSLESQQIDLKDLDETTVVRHSKPSLETFQNNEKGSVVDAND